nr:uncharacterized protein LOC127323165 [Lolium perenne]
MATFPIMKMAAANTGRLTWEVEDKGDASTGRGRGPGCRDDRPSSVEAHPRRAKGEDYSEMSPWAGVCMVKEMPAGEVARLTEVSWEDKEMGLQGVAPPRGRDYHGGGGNDHRDYRSYYGDYRDYRGNNSGGHNLSRGRPNGHNQGRPNDRYHTPPEAVVATQGGRSGNQGGVVVVE